MDSVAKNVVLGVSLLMSLGQVFILLILGNYDLTSFIDENFKDKKGTSLSFRTSLANFSMETPGPGAYEDPRKSIRLTKGMMVGKEARFFYTKQSEKEQKSTPGPGDFDPIFDPKLSIGPSIAFPKDTAQSKVDDQPGPGHYEPFSDSTVNLKSGVKFGKELKGDGDKEPYFVPGPGDYNSHVSPNFYKSQISFPGEKARPPLPQPDNLGPGRYYKEEDKTGGYT